MESAYRTQKKNAIDVLLPCDSSRKTKLKTQRLDRSSCNEAYYEVNKTKIRFIPSVRLVGEAARQPLRETDQDFGSMLLLLLLILTTISI